MTPEHSPGPQVPARPIPCTETGNRRRTKEPPVGFKPLALMPNRDLPPRWKEEWERLADRAHTHPLAAVELHCIDCCGWERTEAADCEIRQCALWGLNLRIFGIGARRKRRQGEQLDA